MKLIFNDGKEMTVPDNEVTIVWDKIDVPGEDGPSELHLKATSEGIVTDIYTSREAPLDHNIGTDSETVQEIATRLVEASA